MEALVLLELTGKQRFGPRPEKFGFLNVAPECPWSRSANVPMLGLALWIVFMVKAYQGEKFKVPVAADIAEALAKRA
jgi:uncharacterized membrane protein